MSSETVVEFGADAHARTCLLLSGIHPGGDHALSRVLTRLGVAVLPRAADQSALQSLHAEILGSAGTDVTGAEALPQGWYASPVYAGFRARAVTLVQAMASGANLFALNDPTIGRLVPFWTDVITACGAVPLLINYCDAAGALPAAVDESPTARSVLWLARLIDTEQAGRKLKRTWVSAAGLRSDLTAAIGRMEQDLGISWPSSSTRTQAAIAADLASLQVAPPAAFVPVSAAHADLLWQVEDVVARWSTVGEDAQGREVFDRVGGQFGESIAVADAAFGLVGRLAEDLNNWRDQAEALRAGVAGVASFTTQKQPDMLPAVTVEGNLAAALADAEARWASIVMAGRNEEEILAEQNAIFQRTISDLADEVADVRQKLAEAEIDVERLNLSGVAQEAEIDKSIKQILALRKQLDTADETIAKLRGSAEEREATIESLVTSLQARANAPVARSGVGSGVAGKLFSSKLLAKLTPKSRRKAQRHRLVRQMVVQSGLFDANFYATRYPDVVAAGGDLLDHFILFGGAEGRHPSGAFNSKWYIAENSDVAANGLNPLVHYLEHGRDEGRRRRTLTDAGTSRGRSDVAAAPPSATSAPPSVPQAQSTAQPGEFDRTWTPRTVGWRALLAADAARRAPFVGLQDLAKAPKAEAISLGGATIGLVGEGLMPHVIDRLRLFTALRGAQAISLEVAGKPVEGLPAHALLGTVGLGIEELADGWCSGQNTLDLRFKGDFSGVVRAFQIHEGTLACRAEVQIAGGEADLVRAEGVNPLEELLLVVSAMDGAVYQCIVLPFPSLLRGGLHHGEFAVTETAPGGMVAMADHVRALTADLIGWPEGPATFAVSRIEVDMHGATGTEPIFRPDVIAALKARHGLVIVPFDDDAAQQRGTLVAALDGGPTEGGFQRSPDGATLVLPCDCLPSLHAIVGRNVAQGGGMMRFAVVDSATLKLRADVTLPAMHQALLDLRHGELPAAVPTLRTISTAEERRGLVAPLLPLAVRHLNRLAWNSDPLMPVSPDQPFALEQPAKSGDGPQLSVIIDMTLVEAPFESCLAALEHQIFAGAIEVILAGWDAQRPVPAATLPVRTFDGRDMVQAARLNGAAALSAAPSLMFLDASVLLSDPRILPVLVQAAHLPGAATAACAVVTELEDEDSAKLHSTGYFPTRISLGGEPVFNLEQADLGRILPAATYPVVANQLKSCVIGRSAWEALGGFDARRFPLSGFDLDFGLRAIAAGLSNYCTTLVRAGSATSELASDFPDPLAHHALRPADWQAVFDRVTVIREMRR